MNKRSSQGRACPDLVARGTRVLALAGVLAALGLLGVLAQASSHDAVDRKLAEFDRAAAWSRDARAASGQARLAASLQHRYDAAVPEEDSAGCSRAGGAPG